MITILTGILSALFQYLSFPNSVYLYGFDFFAWFFAVPLFFSLSRFSPGKRIGLGLLSGIIFYALILKWFIPYSLPGYFLFVLCLTVQPVIFSVLYGWRFQDERLNLLFVPSAWVASEWARTVFMHGFSWGLGYSQTFRLSLIQIASLAGPGALSFVLIFVNYSLFLIVKDRSRKISVRVLPAAVILLLTVYGYGINTLGNAPEEIAGSTKVLSAAAIQPAVDFKNKLDPSRVDEILEKQILITKNIPNSGSLDAVIWPETAIPDDFRKVPELRDKVMGLARSLGVLILTGAALSEDGKLFNGLALVDADGEIEVVYRKQRLVPFSEYVPKGWEWWGGLFGGKAVGFSTGTGGGLLSLAGGRIGFLICSEDTVLSLFRRLKGLGAELAVVVLNDGWFDDPAGRMLHAQMTILHAAACRMPVLRVSNSGWSGFIDPFGRAFPAGDPGPDGPFFFRRTVPLKFQKSFYHLFGDTFCGLCGLFVIMGFIHFSFIRKQAEKS